MTQPASRGAGSRSPLLTLDTVEKSFGSNRVLQDVSFKIRPGEVIGLLGENGTGKSTLMNIVAGALTPSGGRIRYADAEHRFGSIAESIQAGIAFVHQELSVIGSLSVGENLFLGDLPRNRVGLVDFPKIRLASRAMLDAIGATWIDPKMPAGTLRAGEQQLVEIARAAARKPRLLILDEPTSSLTPHEVSAFLSYVTRARTEGTAIIFITHRLEEAMTICDRLLVLRNGAIVADRVPGETSKEQIIRDMTGKDSPFAYRGRAQHQGDIALNLSGICDGGHLEDISLTVRKALNVRMTDDRQLITTLSGGNQQKVIFARALLSDPRLLLLDEPTHGVDVGAKSELYEIIRNAADQGLSVIVASSELPEITALCDRVGVLSKGRLAGVLERDRINDETLLRLAFSEHEGQAC
nr:sugar ABC transporter ATP-binding protein [Paracoccus saliphilus]